MKLCKTDAVGTMILIRTGIRMTKETITMAAIIVVRLHLSEKKPFC